MDQEQESPETHRLRELMSRLDRKRAPWYFDARLQQHLSGQSSFRRFFIFRPVFAIPLGTALTAVMLYLALPDSTEPLQGLPEPEQALPAPQNDDRDGHESQSDSREAEDTQEYQPVDGSPRRGPGGSSDPFIPSTVIPQAPSEENATATPLTIEQTSQDLQVAIEPDSLDSLDRKTDSLRQR